MKTKEELHALKEEFEALNKKLAELTEDELAQITGGEKNDSRREFQSQIEEPAPSSRVPFEPHEGKPVYCGECFEKENS